MARAVWRNVREALEAADWRRKRIRVRTFYDRSVRARVVQILCGEDGMR